MNKFKLMTLFFILGLMWCSYTNQSIAQIDEEVDWDFSGLVKNQNHRKSLEGSSAIKLQYYYHLYYNDELETVDRIVVVFGLRPIINALHYSKFFTEGATETKFSYWLNDSLGLEWQTIRTENVIDKNSEEYVPEYVKAYNEITNDSLFKTNSALWDDDYLKYPINFANLTTHTGEVGKWQINRRDGTIISGVFTTYGEENPLFVDEKGDIAWPDYNLTVAENSFRSSEPESHSVIVSFPFQSIIALSIVFTVILIVKKQKRRL